MYAETGNGIVLGSHPDVLADSLARLGRAPEVDMLTLAEALGTTYSVQPHTRYQGIVQLEPATHYAWTLGRASGGPRSECFWAPRFRTDSTNTDFDGLVEDLASALRHAVRLRSSSRLGAPAVLLSGGADSRAMLFGAETPQAVTCFTLFDEPNSELETARRLASAADARHEALQRSPDYYADNAERAVRISGGMWSIIDAHYTGVVDRLAYPRFGTVLTGCYADYLLKGLSFNRRHRLLFGRALPIFAFTPFAGGYYHAHVPLREPWQGRVDERLLARYPLELRERYPETALAVEDLRLRPLSREADASGRLVLWATTPWAPVFADRKFLDVYERIPAAAKLNGVLFGKAVARITGERARRIPNNNYGAPVGASESARVGWFLAAVLRRKLRRALGLEPGRSAYESQVQTTGGWPNWKAYFDASPMIARLWGAPSAAERELFSDILGQDPWLSSVQEWAARDPILYARILTARLWLRQRGLI
jgi:asparagine synthase (glutamine-hydrolysing)